MLTVVVQHAADVQQIGIAPPEAAGMTVALQSGPEQSQLGTQLRQRWRYSLTASPGSYVIYPGALKIEEAEPIQAEPIFVDVAVQGPVSELAELVLPPEPEPTASWGWIWGIGAGSVCLLALGFALYRWTNRGGLPKNPVQHAQDCWKQLKSDALDEHARAVAMSKLCANTSQI